jgi:Na+/pantothenate symporter
MAYIPVSIGLPAIVMRKRSHVVNMVDEGSLELVRRIPYAVVFVALVVANLAYVGAGPFAGLRSGFGYAMIADATLLILAFSMLIIGKRKRIDNERLREAHVVFLPEWTYAMLLCVLASLGLLLI